MVDAEEDAEAEADAIESVGAACVLRDIVGDLGGTRLDGRIAFACIFGATGTSGAGR